MSLTNQSADNSHKIQADKTIELSSWWGRHTQPVNRYDLWSIGAVDLLTEHHETTWRISWGHIHRSGPQRPKRYLGLLQTRFPQGELEKNLYHKDSLSSSLSRYYPAQFNSVTLPASGPLEDLIFSPRYPIGPLLFYFQSPVSISVGEKFSFGVLIPLNLRIDTSASHGSSRNIASVPIYPLLKTWNGPNSISGAFAQIAEPSIILEQLSQFTPRLDYAICPISLINQGHVSVPVSRILVETEFLNLYHSPQTGFWSNGLLIDVAENQDATTGALIINELPKDAGSPALIEQARRQPTRKASHARNPK